MAPIRPRFKVVRTDRELEMGRVDRQLSAWGADLVVLPDGTPEERLAREVADADLLLMCYARITRRVLEGASRLKAVIKYGVGIAPSTSMQRVSRAFRWSTCPPTPRRPWPRAPSCC